MKEIYNVFFCRICNNINKIQSNFTKSKKLICNNCENIFNYELFFCKKCNKSTYCTKIEPDSNTNYKLDSYTNTNYKLDSDTNTNYKLDSDTNTNYKLYTESRYDNYICICNEIYTLENREIYQDTCCNVS